MMLTRTILLGLAVMGLAAFISGCNQSGNTQDNQAGPTSPSDDDHTMHAGHAANQNGNHGDRAGGHEGHGPHHTNGSHSGPHANLSQLSEADQLSAHEQDVCPVSGKTLGSMGVPVKVEVNGQHVWLCCPGCKPQLEGNPAKYLAKLDR